MSKENVAIFIASIAKTDALKKELVNKDRTDEWVRIAGHAGFEFTADEFTAYVSDKLQRNVKSADAVREYLTHQSKEIGDDALSGVAGGFIKFIKTVQS